MVQNSKQQTFDEEKTNDARYNSYGILSSFFVPVIASELSRFLIGSINPETITTALSNNGIQAGNLVENIIAHKDVISDNIGATLFFCIATYYIIIPAAQSICEDFMNYMKSDNVDVSGVVTAEEL